MVYLTAAKVIVPPQETLGMMDETMRPLLESIITNNVQSRALAATRDYLLPKLLSGEISLDTVEETVADMV